MKILFANPPWWAGHSTKWGFIPLRRVGVRAGSRWPFTYNSFSFPGWHQPFEYLPFPFFLASAAGYVAKEFSVNVSLRDSIARRESDQSFENYVSNGQFDFIFLESATPSWERDSKWIQRLHQISPDSKLVVCGPITAVQSETILADLPVVACIQGEYEKGSADVIRGARGLISHQLMTAEEMNAAPPPLWDEEVATNYFDRNPRGGRFPHLQAWTSRGCPFKCIFCVWPATMTGNDPTGSESRSVRYYTAEALEPYLRERIERHGFKSIYFDDDTFNLGNRHTKEMCDMMRQIGLPWSAMCRADTIPLETWNEMKRSGCYGVKIGFESGSQFVVDKIVNKHLDLKQASEVVHHLRKIGMTVHGTFTVGLPGETPDQMRETLSFIKSLPLNSHQISGTAEIEGTPLHRLRAEGKLAAYAGASVDQHYDRAVDGNKKWQELSERLRGEG